MFTVDYLRATALSVGDQHQLLTLAQPGQEEQLLFALLLTATYNTCNITILTSIITWATTL